VLDTSICSLSAVRLTHGSLGMLLVALEEEFCHPGITFGMVGVPMLIL